MKALRFIYKTSVCLPVSLLLLVLASCQPDEERRHRPHVPEGEAATVSLKWTMPAMDENRFQLCAPVSDERARRIEDLWIGIYNVKTGACTAKLLFDLNADAPEHTAQKIRNIKTKSGESYIVAVANVRNALGVSDLLKDGDTARLGVLLQMADTWAKYKSISAVLPQPGFVRPEGSLVMAGSFLKGGVDATPAAWSDGNGNPEPVTINPGMTDNMGGYIHLRRLFAYNRFTVTAGENVKMNLSDWQVCNLPVMSYLQERRSENAADVFTKFKEKNLPGYEDNHATMPVSHIFESGDKDGEYVFDFYQFENRHAGLKKNAATGVGVSDYQDRDREWKTETGTNTGIYKSLCATDAEPVPGPAETGVNTNNYATYLVLRAEVSYYVASLDVGAKPVGHPDGPRKDGWILRTGYATYVIHLGYCEGKAMGADSLARDFNVRRNNWYDYKVTINGLSNIGLEGTTGTTENQPGAEGDVFDSENIVELDAHNCVFNIKMTNAQRTSLQWIVSAPYGNTVHHLTYKDYPDGEAASNLRQNQFYNWIRIKPAPSENLLAVYKESEGESDALLWTLENFRDVENYPGIDGNGVPETYPDPKDDKTERYYTVFVKEYTYEDGPDESQSGNWRSYVNRPARVAYLNTKAAISDDGESVYMKPQYTIIQHSIQTYYDLYAPMTTALGVERENEGYGLNMRWVNVSAQAGGGKAEWNPDNGRWNEWDYLTDGAMGESGKQWYGGILQAVTTVNGHNYLRAASTQAINNRQYENKPAATHPVYALRPIEHDKLYPEYHTDPSDANEFYQYMDACLNRNRDENGNGVIDRAELKWYLATSGKYFRIVMGRRSLDEPLMKFGVPLAPQNELGYATRHHYASSDQKIIWAEEGIASSDLSSESNDRMPWQVRCVRNLGVNFNNVLHEDPVQPAYRGDVATRMVYLDYYDAKSLRPTQTGTIPVHKVDAVGNMTARRFEYAGEDCKSTKGTATALGVNEKYEVVTYDKDGWWSTAYEGDLHSFWEASVAANEICGQYTQFEYGGTDKGTWRVPNQKELTIMLRLGVFTENGCKWLSCSEEYYPQSDKRRFYGVFVKGNGVGQGTMGQAGAYRIRCVRDVE